jgi:hypothetical protein
MRTQIIRQLEDRTGLGVVHWNGLVAEQGLSNETSVRAWLQERGVTGYPQNLLVWERFGYPDFLTADAAELIAGQYRDRDQLRPILDSILGRLSEVGEVAVQARKTYVSLVSPQRTFAAIQPTTKRRVDPDLRLDGPAAAARLQPARAVGNGAMTARIGLTSVGDVDDEVIAWLRRAYAENSAPANRAASGSHRRPAPASLGWLSVVIEGHDLPGIRRRRGEPRGELTQWSMRTSGLNRAAAHARTLDHMRTMPARRDHPSLARP